MEGEEKQRIMRGGQRHARRRKEWRKEENAPSD
jgi:hypothetical protein